MEILAACDMEVGWYNKLNEGIQVIKINVPLALAKHHSDTKLKLVLKNHSCHFYQVLYFCAYTRPRYQVSAYMIIGPKTRDASEEI